jgi:hypothetical protein
VTINDLDLFVQPGAGVVSRWGAIALVVSDDEGSPEASELIDIVKDLGDHEAPGRLAAHRVARAVTAMELDRIPTFGLVADADRGVAVMLHGPMRIAADGPDGDVALSGVDRPTWVDDYLVAEIDHIDIVPEGETPAEDPASTMDLSAGTVPGGAALFRRRGDDRVDDDEAVAEPAEPTPTPVTDIGAAGDSSASAEPVPDFEVVDLSAPPPSPPEPLPTGPEAMPAEASVSDGGVLVLGKLCKNDHFNHPEAANCVICGVAFHETVRLQRGPRLPLGLLVFDDGATFTVDATYVIGRQPEQDPAVTLGEARALARQDPDKTMSRVHAELSLDEWEVRIADRRSTNGTLYQRGDAHWLPVQPDRPVTLRSGDRVRMGGHSFVFESHHKGAHL